ncbi:hypothetical protein Tco_0114096 [Tanacetum coccineum]
MCGRMFHEESKEVEKYVGGLPDMIWGNVMSYQPKAMEKTIKFSNDQMDQKVLTITERQAEQKRKLEFNAGNNQGHQQQNNRQNTRRAYTARPGEKRKYTGSLLLCTKCNYHHKGPCAPRCNKSTITPTTLDHYYDVELADGKIIGINTIIRPRLYCSISYFTVYILTEP